MIRLTGFPGLYGTGWVIQQDERDVTVLLCENDEARDFAGLCAHRASLLGVLAARPVTMHVDCTVEHLLALRSAMDVVNRCREKTGAPRLDVRVNIVLHSPLDCAHPAAVLVTPCRGDRCGHPTWICKGCGSFRRSIGRTWGGWELSAPNVEAVHFPDPDGPAEIVPWPEGAVFWIQEAP